MRDREHPDLLVELDEYDRIWEAPEKHRRASSRSGTSRTSGPAIRLAQGRATDALAAAEDAAARCTAMGGAGRFRGAFVRLARAEALHATGAPAAARRAITAARAHLLAIADQIPDPAYRQSFLEHVPENARHARPRARVARRARTRRIARRAFRNATDRDRAAVIDDVQELLDACREDWFRIACALPHLAAPQRLAR